MDHPVEKCWTSRWEASGCNYWTHPVCIPSGRLLCQNPSAGTLQTFSQLKQFYGFVVPIIRQLRADGKIYQHGGALQRYHRDVRTNLDDNFTVEDRRGSDEYPPSPLDFKSLFGEGAPKGFRLQHKIITPTTKALK
ncbi:hypothetical protein L798_14131 [Zootermopsis nevadensis]|uniref:Uncharacterized protein n=1 Tax=Zootermopsis nevadensis TaxID=136037 RepID=A0A067R2H7_ZOONE|nr:hypothetical protein L798_14131 [Zootermopsis nevadensis]